MTEEMMLKIAIEIANNTGSIKGLDCPRTCKNPGLFFGAMLALQAAKEKGLLSKRQPGELG